MKLPGLALALAALTLSSCERTSDTSTTTTQTNNADTITVTRTESERNLSDFREWVNEKTSRGDSLTLTRREWPEIKEGFKQRTAELDRNMDSLSAESKAEYKALRERYQNWEAEKDRRTSTPLDAAKIKTFETDLLGSYSNYGRITANNIKEVYVTFMQQLRSKRHTYSPNDWDYVDHVYGKLNDRKDQLEGDIATSDGLKIRALQTEYLTLEAAGDVKDLGRDLQK